MEGIVVVGLVLIAMFAAAVVYRNKTSLQRLRSSFGPEYERLAQRGESPRAIRRELTERETRVKKLHIVPLSAERKGQLSESWKSIQARFVDEPAAAVSDAEKLLEQVMRARGYPEADPPTRLADLSVHHAHVLPDYREAREIGVRQREGRTNTEDLRRAMVHYRSLFEDLLDH